MILWWISFHLLIAAILIFDLGFNKEMTFKKSIGWTIVWIGVSLLFNLVVYEKFGSDAAKEFLTAYVLEKSLSIDNIFLMTIIFSHFKIEKNQQHQVLLYGILGAIFMRMGLILGGVALVERFHFILYFFGAILAFTGIKMFFSKPEHHHSMDEKVWMKWIKKLVPGITPFMLCLITIEMTDLVFAFDSIPATLTVTKNPFVAYTSNIFAILGLRALYFAFAGLVGLFRFLSKALSIILLFIGGKMMIEPWFKIENTHSLIVVLFLLTSAIALSLIIKEKK